MKLSQNKIGLLILLIFLFAAVWNTCSQTVLCPEGRNQTGISIKRVGMRGSFALFSQEGKVALDTITFYLEENNVRMRSHALFTVGLTNKVMAEMYLSNDTSFQVVYERRKERQEKLQKALVLGNIYKTHVQLMMVNSSHQHIKTTATVWAVTEKYVTLKGGVVIPVGSIMDIVF